MYLAADGDFGVVEAEIVKYKRQQSEEWVRGGMHTEASLTQLGWTELLGFNCACVRSVTMNSWKYECCACD